MAAVAARTSLTFDEDVRATALLLLLLACREVPTSPSEAPVLPAPGDFGGRPATIHYDALLPFLPALPGWSGTRDEGSIGKYGEVSITEAERIGTAGDRRVRVRIVDTTLNAKLGHAIRAAATHALEQDGPESPRALMLEGGVGFVRYDHDDAEAEVNLLVGERFVVAVTASGVEGTDEVRRIARSVDVAGLARLR